MPIILESKKLDNRTRKLIGVDAGTSDAARETARIDKIESFRRDAEDEYKRAVRAHKLGKNDSAREHVDKSLKHISAAFWYAEDTDLEDAQHEKLHQIAKWNHDTLGCLLVESDTNNYISSCAIALTHKKMGASVGFTGIALCSVCHKDTFECTHLCDRTYWVQGGLHTDGDCKICTRKACDTHPEDYIFRVCPSRVIREPVLHEISIVKKPAYPLARLTGIPIPRKTLEQRFGPLDKSKGMVYLCHVCGGACPGFEELDASARAS